MGENLNIANIARGALLEQFDVELEKVLTNIADPNTDTKKARQIDIKVVFKPNNRRDGAEVNFQTKSKLIPAVAVETSIFIDKDGTGKIYAAELSKGAILGQEEIDYETGEILSGKVVGMRK